MTETYKLPFNVIAHEVKISQGRNGPHSHFVHEPKIKGGKGTDYANAVDFLLPLGSGVLAARDGICELVIDDSTFFYDGLDPKVGNSIPVGKTNLIIVNHNDRTHAVYSHLANGGLFVQPGDYVKTGDLIANTGKSGWIGKNPHVHFMVYDESFHSIPVTFENYSGRLEHSDLFPANLHV